MQESIIECTIVLEPWKLDGNIKSYLLDKLREVYINKYIKSKCCYVISIDEIISISNYISNGNSELIFNTTCKATVIITKIGSWVSGKCKIAKGIGIFVVIENDTQSTNTSPKIETITKIYIKNENVISSAGVSYCSKSNTYIRDGKVIFKDDTVASIQIINMEFINGSYKYIGNNIKEIN